MGNDNNLLLIILIAAVLFWIFNINTTEKFREHYKEHYEQPRVKSPLFEHQDLTDEELINQLHAEKDKKNKLKANSSNGDKNTYPNGIEQNPEQQLMNNPPNENSRPNVQQYYKPSTQDILTPDTLSFDNDSYMLLPKNSMPDERFKKVMSQETRDPLLSKDLLPIEKNPDWFQTPGDKFNLLQAVDLELPEIKIGVDTVGQSRKNASYDLRAAPQCPKFVTGPWNNSTIEPDYNIKPMC
jgi:hypothetical protein